VNNKKTQHWFVGGGEDTDIKQTRNGRLKYRTWVQTKKKCNKHQSFWENYKKEICDGNHPGKESYTRKRRACGDPTKGG